VGARLLIVDGYSLLHRDSELAPLLDANLPLARQRLLRKIEPAASALAENALVVFDGRQGGPDEGYSSPTLEVLFAPAGKTADDVIEQRVLRDSHPGEIVVVTSDRSEQETVTAAGAHAMSCAAFLDLCRGDLRQKARSSRRPSRGNTLGDFFPR